MPYILLCFTKIYLINVNHYVMCIINKLLNTLFEITLYLTKTEMYKLEVQT